MPFAAMLDWIRHRPTQENTAVALPPEPGSTPIPQAGYYQIRLAEMRLTDERRFFREIAPATFVLTEFNHGSERVRRPFFVSNGLLADLPHDIDGNRLRVNFRDTLVLGPTPAVGGDVVVFIGLFEMAIDDRLKSAFAILEKLFQVVPGPVGTYIKLADRLAGEISACLGDANLRYLLGDRSLIGSNLPAAGYRAYLKANGVPLDGKMLSVVDGKLMQRVDGTLAAVTDRDYCLVKVEHLSQRDDYASLPFHAVFETARMSAVKGDRDTARLQMLECIGMVYGSPDLSEDDKIRLITFYQAKLLATQSLRGDEDHAGPSPVLEMQARILQTGLPDNRALADALGTIGTLHAKFKAQTGTGEDAVTNDDVKGFLQTTPPFAAERKDTNKLIKAIAAATLAP